VKVKNMSVGVNIHIIVDTTKMPIDVKKEWNELIERLRKLPNVTIEEMVKK
jgi:hypothetical protein